MVGKEPSTWLIYLFLLGAFLVAVTFIVILTFAS